MAQTQRPVLAAQTALVTGANSGIGRAVAIALGRAGANVLVNYVTDASATETVVEEIRRFGASALAYQADVSNKAADCGDVATGTPTARDGKDAGPYAPIAKKLAISGAGALISTTTDSSMASRP
jgi:NAD(P)-dependent dehydrogenase (short-subunit alcohol dehydrogenase family)